MYNGFINIPAKDAIKHDVPGAVCVPQSAVRPGYQFISHEPGVIYRLKIGGCGPHWAQSGPDNAVMSTGLFRAHDTGPVIVSTQPLS